MKPTKTKQLLSGLAVYAALALSAGAATITPTAIYDFSSEFNNSSLSAVNTINSSGFTGTTHDNTFGTMWVTAGTTSGTITFDLGDNYDLSELKVWNFNAETGRGAKDVVVWVATNTVSPTFVAISTNVFAQADGTAAYAGETIAISATKARLVRLEISSSYGYDAYMGLSEVRFTGVLSSAPPAGGVLTPTAIYDFSSEFNDSTLSAVNTINSSGFTGTTHNNSFGTMWVTAGTTSGTITFDLGDNYNLTAAKVWNFNAELDRGAKDVVVWVATNTVSPTFVAISTNVFAQASGSATYSGETIAISATNARLVRFEITSNYGNAYMGLSEVRFIGVLTTPPTVQTVQIAATDNSASETPGYPGTFTVSRTGPNANALTVLLAISGTASNGVDYTVLATNAIIPAGSNSVQIAVLPVNDALDEGSFPETVILTLLSDPAYTLGATTNATVNLIDNDFNPVLGTWDFENAMAGSPNCTNRQNTGDMFNWWLGTPDTIITNSTAAKGTNCIPCPAWDFDYPSINQFSAGEFTLSMWIRKEDNTQYFYPIDRFGVNTGNFTNNFDITSAEASQGCLSLQSYAWGLRFVIGDGTYSYAAAWAYTPPNAEWVHYLITFDNGNATFYTNGVAGIPAQISFNGGAYSSATNYMGISAIPAPNGLTYWRVGGATSTSLFPFAYEDEIGLWAKVLTPEEIGNVYSNGLASIETVIPTPPTATNITYTLTGNQLVLTWPNGQGWLLESQTNSLATGLGNNWVTNTGATSPFTNTIDPSQPAVFYRLKY